MLALIQRVTSASVAVEDRVIGAINRGLLVFLAVQREDTQVQARALVKKLLGYRIFPDDQGKMNLSVAQVSGAVLVVSQFTLAADTRKGMRPSFTSAAPPGQAQALYREFVACLRASHPAVATGEFAADMSVELVNDGPVTFLLSTSIREK